MVVVWVLVSLVVGFGVGVYFAPAVRGDLKAFRDQKKSQLKAKLG
jgi:hypothetical protein